MGRKYEVEQHPQRQQIVRALARGESFRDVAGRFGISRSALHRFLKNKLIARAAETRAELILNDGKDILDEINKIMVRVQKMWNACDEWLSDPNNSEKYYLGPRADELSVVYLEKIDDKWVTRRNILSTILHEKDENIAVSSVHYRHADPRRLFLETARVLAIQLELLAKISGEIKDVTINIINTPVWICLQQIILDATKDKPEVRNKIADALHAITESGRSS